MLWVNWDVGMLSAVYYYKTVYIVTGKHLLRCYHVRDGSFLFQFGGFKSSV